jgi:hypothetical protein
LPSQDHLFASIIGDDSDNDDLISKHNIADNITGINGDMSFIDVDDQTYSGESVYDDYVFDISPCFQRILYACSDITESLSQVLCSLATRPRVVLPPIERYTTFTHCESCMSSLAPIDYHADDFQVAPSRARYAFSSFRRQCLRLILWDRRIAQLVGWDDHAEEVCSYNATEHAWRSYPISFDIFRSLPIASDTQLLACWPSR